MEIGSSSRSEMGVRQWHISPHGMLRVPIAARSDRKFPPEALSSRQYGLRPVDAPVRIPHERLRKRQRPAPDSCFVVRFRLVVITGKIDPKELRETVPLHPSYRAMAETNGVPPDDPAFERCHDG